jgi:hypothetical protein
MTVRNLSPQVFTDLPSGAIAQTSERRYLGTKLTLLTGRAMLSAIYLVAGTTVTSATFASSNTALSGGANGWVALYNPSLNLDVQSTDAVPTWGANSLKTFTFSSQYVLAVTGWHVVALMITATTPNNVEAYNVGSAPAGITPIMGGGSNQTSLTGTAPGSVTLGAGVALQAPWCYLS